MKHVVLIFLFLSALLVTVVRSTRNCCDTNVFVVNRGAYTARICENSKDLVVNCSTHTNILNNGWSDYSHFMVRSDKKGEYLDAYGFGYITRAPYYCTGLMKNTANDDIQEVAFVCQGNKIWYSDILDEEKPPPAPFRERIFPLMCEVLNLASALTLAATALIYGLLRDLQDSQGICTFHFVLSTSLLHTTLFWYLAGNTDGLLPSLCITNLYLNSYVLLCSFTWCAIMGYNSWIHIKNVQRIIDEETLLKRYRWIGYGLPLVMIVLSNIYAHARRLYSDFRVEWLCEAHQTAVLAVTIALPVITASFANAYFFFDMQKYLWNSPALELRSEKSTLRKLKYRLFLNGKLFFILGISWLVLFFSTLLKQILRWDYTIIIYSQYAIVLLISGQGVLIFLLLVFCRKRVLKRVSRTWLTRFNIFPSHWNNVKDSETAEDDVDETMEHSFAFAKDSGIITEIQDTEAKDKTATSAEALFSS